jgi:hypothetical protein
MHERNEKGTPHRNPIALRALNRIVYEFRRAAIETHHALILSSRKARLCMTGTSLPLHKEYIVIDAAIYETGMFSQLASIVGLLEHYEAWSRRYAGLRLGRFSHGLYYDPTVGGSWWNYFFEPIELGASDNGPVYSPNDQLQEAFATRTEVSMPREQAAEIVRRHIRLNRETRRMVDALAEHHFKDDYVIGIHYRGTDKCTEVPLVPYDRVRAAVLEQVNASPSPRCKLFVATDEQAFLDYMREHFGDRLAYCDAFRSTDGSPTDTRQGDNFRKGLEAVLDCVLLSRCNHLIRTDSNLSLFSTFFAPKIPVTFLTTLRPRRVP